MIAKSGKAAQIDMVTWMHRPSIVQGYLDHLLEGQQTQFIQPFEDWWEDFNVSLLLHYYYYHHHHYQTYQYEKSILNLDF